MAVSQRWSAVLIVSLLVAAATACADDGSSGSTTSSTAPSGVPETARAATVVAAVDADTVRVAFADGTGAAPSSSGVDVSVIGVVGPGAGTCLAAESAAFAGQQLPSGATVYLAADAQDTGPDGTLLRYVWNSDGGFYNDRLLRQGLARTAPAPPNQRYQEQLSGAESEAMAARRGVWGCATTTTLSSARPTTTAPRPTSTTRSTTAPTTSRPTTSPSTTATVPTGRTVSLGATFSVGVGETLQVAGEGLSVTFSGVLSDNRCRPGMQCIVAGNAVVSVAVAKAGMAPAGLALSSSSYPDLSSDPPTSARYGNYTVELVRLSFGQASIASLKVT